MAYIASYVRTMGKKMNDEIFRIYARAREREKERKFITARYFSCAVISILVFRYIIDVFARVYKKKKRNLEAPGEHELWSL